MTEHTQQMMDLISQMGPKNQKFQALAQMLAAQNQDQQEDLTNEANKKLVVQVKKQAALIRRLSDSNKKLKNKIKYLLQNLKYRLEVNDALAGATGSCPECWGQDNTCKTCEGQGGPGSLPIDEESFMIFIQPLIEQYVNSNQDENFRSISNPDTLNNSLN